MHELPERVINCSSNSTYYCNTVFNLAVKEEDLIILTILLPKMKLSLSLSLFLYWRFQALLTFFRQ
jgi:hypothetical protein